MIALARVIPFAFAAGINLYATVIVLGLAARYDLIALPEQFSAFLVEDSKFWVNLVKSTNVKIE